MNGITGRSRTSLVDKTTFLQHARQQPRPAVAPFDVATELRRLIQALHHDRMARLETHDAPRNEVRVLARKELRDGRNAIREAYDVGITMSLDLNRFEKADGDPFPKPSG